MHFVFICICVAIFCLTTSSLVDSLLLKLCGCFSPYNIQSFGLFTCLIVAFLSRSSLLCCCLLSIIKCALSSCTFHFFKPVFVISWSSSLTNKFHSFDLFYSPSLSSLRSKFSTFSSFSIRFWSCRFPFYFSSSLQLFGLFLPIVIQWSLVFKPTFFLPQKCYISFRKKKP